MKPSFGWLGPVVGGLTWLLGVGMAMAQGALLIEFRHTHTNELGMNYQSLGGMPLSQTIGDPPGSNGNQPGGNESSGIFVPPSPGQFRNLLSLGGIPGLSQSDWVAMSDVPTLRQGNTPFSGSLAESMFRPRGLVDGQVVMVLRRAEIGMPYLSRQVSFPFGAIVQVPEKDENGVLLKNVPNTSYWLPEPYYLPTVFTSNQHADRPYYWSPHARKVYAIQAGPISITWRKAQPYQAGQLPDYVNLKGSVSYQTNGANIFLLFTEDYMVSGSAVQPPRKMYWTERGFRSTGHPVRVPSARVSTVNIVYSLNFPRTVTAEYEGVGNTSPTEGTGNQQLPELRTLWYDQQQGNILAYNAEGRVFVELLGDLHSDGQTYEPLGIEIVDVTKQPLPSDVTVELGDRILPPDGASLDALFPQPPDQGVNTGFAFRHDVTPSGKPELYATRATINLNDYLVHWLEEGQAGLRWPKYLARYRLVWPTDMGRYSHYLRPAAATDAEAARTAVLLDPENAPTIEYQDPLDRPRARFTPELKFYTWLDAQYPAHRTLLRFVSGENIAFERVLSTLNTALQEVVGLADETLDVPVALRQAGANSVLQLDGQPESYGQLPPGSYIGTGAFTIESWVFTRETRPGSRVIDFGNGPAADNLVLSLSHGASGRPSLHWYRGGVDTGSFLVGRTPLPLNRWVHLAATFDGTTARLYQNGYLDAQGAFEPATQVVVRQSAYVGRSHWETDAAAYAHFDNLRIWANSRSTFEIQESMTRDYPSGTPGLVAQFTFTRLENPTADSSGNGYAMTLFGRAETGVPGINPLAATRYVARTVSVGERIEAPPGELGVDVGGEYLAGYILTSAGTSYHPGAYRDPFVVGFDLANQGAIIPVNAMPDNHQLEVWWFRRSNPDAGLNAGHAPLGFRTIHWPSVIGRYTVQWPTAPREIVLASRLGGTDLSAAEQQGTLYYQNNPALHGYNPNEEHALMSGGTPFATRDDLNVLAPPDKYSSHPFVLVDYQHPDGRPAMSVFRVLREKPEAGWVFDDVVPAGRILQPPPPLNFLGKPVEGIGEAAVHYTYEPTGEDGDLPGNWDVAGTGRFGHYDRFTYRDRKHDVWVYRGPHAGLPPLQAGTYNAENDAFDPVPTQQAVADQPFRFHLHVSRQPEFLSLTVSNAPEWLTVSGMTLVGTPGAADVGNQDLQLRVQDRYDPSTVTLPFSLQVLASGSPWAQAPLSILSSNRYTGTVIEFTNRPPFLARSPNPGNAFTLRYYYPTEPSFAWPGLLNPPAPGSIVPYLRPYDPDSGTFVGDPGSKHTPALDIVYRPFWPEQDPKDAAQPIATLPYGGTLVEPGFNLPGVHDFKTAHLLYQQSIARDLTQAEPSAVLHDPTRAKYVDIATVFDDGIPASVKAEYQRGRFYFPGLPPHLVDRVFVDPNRGEKGSLALIGAYSGENDLLGEGYLLLNVLRDADLAAVQTLCPAADELNHPKWVALVNALATAVETFREDLPLRPQTYAPDPAQTVVHGVGELADIESDNTAVDSYALSATGPGSGYVTLIESSGTAFTLPGDPVSMHIFKVGGGLHPGQLTILPAPNPLSEQVTFQHTADMAGRFEEYEYEWKIAAPVDGEPPLENASMSNYLPLAKGANHPFHLLGGAGIQALGDHYLVLRYRPLNPAHPLFVEEPTDADWSEWTPPALAEGWIKRVLAGINPFNQRINDLFNNRVNTDASILTQAGRRWEGDVALNLESIHNYGLIEIYETVLRRGRALSIEAGYNHGPANDALLLAAGYLNDLYLMLGNEAWADASNPTIGIGTADNTYGDIATAQFAFRGQMPSLLEEELALLRGRDDFLQPGVEVNPVYNRLVWNYTRGIDAGEVIYAVNYNIQENPDQSPDGVINASDAARMYPQGHGDAYGHYLTALKGYYSLLLNQRFDWVPRIEAVNVLGQAVAVDYQDERKFAAAAAALARAGRQVFDLTWRRDYRPLPQSGWDHFTPTRVNPRRTYHTDTGSRNPERFWGLDHWASRVGQGTYLHWIAGNAILPYQDPDPTHEGIQKVDRTTVPELKELATLAAGLQTALDNAEAGQSPLGIPEGGLAFDINPALVTSSENGTHFEQIYTRATSALNNAVAAFDDAKDVTRLMRSEQDSLADFQNSVARQEQAYTVALIELYGTPYPDDMGPGQLYRQDYTGPDLIHYGYVDLPEAVYPELWSYSHTHQWTLALRDLPRDWVNQHGTSLNFPVVSNITFNLGPHGFAEKPPEWSSRRYAPGRIQQAISEHIMAHTRLRQSINDVAGNLMNFQKALNVFEADKATYNTIRDIKYDLLIADEVLEKTKFANNLFQKFQDSIIQNIVMLGHTTSDALPKSLIVGLANGGDLTFAGRAAIQAAGLSLKQGFETASFIRYTVVNALDLAVSTSRRWKDFSDIAVEEHTQELRHAVHELGRNLGDLQNGLWTINERLRESDDKQRAVRALIARGDTLQAEREIFRQRASAVVQGYRTRDAAFRIFRNEKLERYQSLFDLAARYSLLAANAFDYETGLLGTTAGRDFKQRLIRSRALGVVRAGQPQFAGSNTGDPGLSSALAEMKADWDVLRGRLGFNNPDAYSTTVSLRTEQRRLLPGAEGDTAWRDFLHGSRLDDILADGDVRRFCLQVDPGNGLPVPGLVITFSTTIADGLNLLGQPLAAGDHSFSPSSFATKIFAVGAALEGYRGMANPAANAGAIDHAGGVSAPDPDVWFLDPSALAATPYIYLIPVGVDSMRTPPLGDTSTIRTWNVEDLAIPLPFNIGASTFSDLGLFQSGETLTEPLFGLRKHQAFRPVASADQFTSGIYFGGGLLRSQFTNNRLIGRSVWNSQWKLVIPGRTLLENPHEGLDRFIRTVTDIRLHFVTYSYSGN
jgi:hypothetical protein